MPSRPTNQKIYDEIVAQVKTRVQRWPSAYASGMVVKEYKRIMATRNEALYVESASDTKPLARWYKEKWIDIATGAPCGSTRTAVHYPTCRPSVRIDEHTPVLASELTTAQRARAIKIKQAIRERHVDFQAAAQKPKAQKQI